MIEQRHIDYWRDRQIKQKQYHQKLAQQARQEAALIVDLLVQKYNVRRVILFGSLVRDRFVAESDIDLAVEELAPSCFLKHFHKLTS